jgi:hypothetical protein
MRSDYSVTCQRSANIIPEIVKAYVRGTPCSPSRVRSTRGRRRVTTAGRVAASRASNGGVTFSPGRPNKPHISHLESP